jgi:hypothetical protein
MIKQRTLLLLTVFYLPLFAFAAEQGSPPIQLRAVLHDPVNPKADLFVGDVTGKVVQLGFRIKDLSNPVLVPTFNGSLVLYDKASIDPAKPNENLAATCKIPVGAKRGIIVVLPNLAGTKPPYRMLFIDDSAKSFPLGEAKILTLLAAEVAIEAGEHKLQLRPGEITRFPPVKKVDEFHMAQTNFYYKQDANWIVFAERQLQYLDAIRRIFIVHVTPGALQPTVDTIIDTIPPTTPLITR